jgi:hypothetical protein
LPRPGIRRLVCDAHLVKFCPPSECTGGQAVAVVDYCLICGHRLRTQHYAGKAYLAKRGLSVAPATMTCPACSRGDPCACAAG